MPKPSRVVTPPAKAQQSRPAQARELKAVQTAPSTSPPERVSVIARTRTPFNFPEWIPANVFNATRNQPIRLAVPMRNQCHSNWCWAAVAESIARFYNEKTNCTQCVIAKTRLNSEKCCDAPCGSDDKLEYNVASTLESTLAIFDASAGIDVENRPAALDRVQQEVKNARPVCVRVVWTLGAANGGGHFVVIAGYVPDTERLLVLDPLGPEERETTYQSLAFFYPPHGGKWRGTYYTQESKKPCPDKRGRNNGN